MFQRDEFVAHFFGILGCLLQYFICLAAQVRFATGHLGQGVDLFVNDYCYLLPVHAQFLEDEIGDVFTRLHYSLHDVDGFNRLLSPALHQIYGFLHRFLGFDGKIVKVHMVVLLSFHFSNNTWKGSKDLPSRKI